MSSPMLDPYRRWINSGKHFRIATLSALAIALPIPMTDFLVSAGVIPVLYLILRSLLQLLFDGPESLLGLLLYWIVIPWSLLILFAVRALDRRLVAAYRPRAFGQILAILLVLSILPVYFSPSHGRVEGSSLIDLYRSLGDGIARWCDHRPPRDWTNPGIRTRIFCE